VKGIRPRTLRAQALVILGLLIALVVLGASRVVVHEMALTNASATADHDRQIQLDAAAFLTGMLNEEAGVRGFVNTAQQQFLEPYSQGRTQVAQAENRLGAELGHELRAQLQRVEDAAAAWQGWAATRVAAVNSSGTPLIDVAQSAVGNQLFETFRSAEQVLESQVATDFASVQAQARTQSSSVVAASVATAVLVIAVLLFLALIVYRSTLRPLSALFGAASALAAGERADIPSLRSDNEVGQLARALEAWKRTEVGRLTLVKTANELNSRVELKEILDLGSERLRDVLDCPHVTISLADSTGLRMILIPDATPEESGADPHQPIASPSSQAFRTRQTVITDLRSPGWDDVVVRWRDAHSAGPALAVPLFSGGDLLGVVTCVRRADQEPFTETDRDRAELVAPSLGSSIRVSLLFENLKESGAKLDLANRHKTVFLANMSHELRTPLNAILGFSQLMIDDPNGAIDAKTRLRFLDQINSSGQHLLGLINDILDLSKVEAGQMDLRLATIGLAETIDLVLMTVQPLAAKKDIRIMSDASRDLKLMADPGKLKQMLLNLVSNGIKFTPPRGQVTITARGDESMIEIDVSDTGIGMSTEDLQLIFQEFRQLDQGSDRLQEGTGLGLALTKRLAELHGGTVSVKSTKGSGSTFTLRMPVGPQSAKSEADPVAALSGASDLTLPLVLVVEDNPQASELLARHLAGGGFRMAIARTGTEALSKARDLKPVAITLDILLPEIDGWEVLTRLKQDEATRNIPVVVVSVVDNPQLGRALGALDYFVKPVDRQALLSRLGAHTFTTKVRQQEIRILMVDDEPANLDLLQSILQPAGFTLSRAPGGREAIEMARADKPHLILLDLLMPDMSGFDVVAALRGAEATRSIPIMVLTAKDLTDEDRRQLNGQVAAVFERNSLAGAELIGWLHQLVGV
jgi:signal transduction histidine kinase/DNA-binding response OmpR family regulator/CHASE3 domain sensor protein